MDQERGARHLDRDRRRLGRAADREGLIERLSTGLLAVAATALALAATLDAIRDHDEAATASEASPAAASGPKRWRIDLESTGDLVAAGPGMRTRVLLGGREYLAADAIARAFPVRGSGELNIAKLAVAPDNAVAVGIFRLPPAGRIRAGIEVWRDRRIVGAFAVPAGSFSSGLWFVEGGRALAAISWKETAAVYDFRGRRLHGDPYFAYETG